MVYSNEEFDAWAEFVKKTLLQSGAVFTTVYKENDKVMGGYTITEHPNDWESAKMQALLVGHEVDGQLVAIHYPNTEEWIE